MADLSRVGAALLAACALQGCSTVMEANRPEPVNLAKYGVGERRMDVIARLGAPTNTVQDSGQSCDIYKLYTHGVSKVGKGAIILGEAAADFFTLGLAEAVATPGEAMTKNKQHTVLFCYSPAGELSSISDEGVMVTGARADAVAQAAKPAASVGQPASSPTPVARPAAQP